MFSEKIVTSSMWDSTSWRDNEKKYQVISVKVKTVICATLVITKDY